jgi:hypothetical protein
VEQIHQPPLVLRDKQKKLQHWLYMQSRNHHPSQVVKQEQKELQQVHTVANSSTSPIYKCSGTRTFSSSNNATSLSEKAVAVTTAVSVHESQLSSGIFL